MPNIYPRQSRQSEKEEGAGRSSSQLTSEFMIKWHAEHAKEALRFNRHADVLIHSRDALRFVKSSPEVSSLTLSDVFCSRGATLIAQQSTDLAVLTLESGKRALYSRNDPTAQHARAKLLVELGHAYRVLRRFDKAQSELHDALKSIEALVISDARVPIEARWLLRELRIGVLAESGRLELDQCNAPEAIGLFKTALEQVKNIEECSLGQPVPADGSHPSVLRAKLFIDLARAHSLHSESDSSVAVLLFQDAEQLLCQRYAAPDSPLSLSERIDILDTQGRCFQECARAADIAENFDLAALSFRKALRNRVRLLGKNHLETQRVLESFAEFEANQEHPLKAVQHYESALFALVHRCGGTLVDALDVEKINAARIHIECSNLRCRIALPGAPSEEARKQFHLAVQEAAEAEELIGSCKSAPLSAQAELAFCRAALYESAGKTGKVIQALRRAIQFMLPDSSVTGDEIGNVVAEVGRLTSRGDRYVPAFFRTVRLICDYPGAGPSLEHSGDESRAREALAFAYGRLSSEGEARCATYVGQKLLLFDERNFTTDSVQYATMLASIAENIEEQGLFRRALRVLDLARTHHPIADRNDPASIAAMLNFQIRIRELEAQILVALHGDSNPKAVLEGFDKVFRGYRRGVESRSRSRNEQLRRCARYLLSLDPIVSSAHDIDVVDRLGVIFLQLRDLQPKSPEGSLQGDFVCSADSLILAQISERFEEIDNAIAFSRVAVELIASHPQECPERFVDTHRYAGLLLARCAAQEGALRTEELMQEAVWLLERSRSRVLHNSGAIYETLEEKLEVRQTLLDLYEALGETEKALKTRKRVNALHRRIGDGGADD